ncbi:signal transduction histidine kinase [Tamaricihabitans halophyticus]|uniref:histidine kinase n=1 Tax=Tamaricihabitans halophyticus TaxID=1262583 RepID=A0A4V2SV22_9PSEU|nr:histidine kinase [Tamaricihabitans halophyticus]TCP56816.1 signal transduction histidine kinase [Tamaricihabitans halophyticus]
MTTGAAPRLGGWQQAWRLAAAVALGVFLWLSTAALLPPGCAVDGCSWFVTGDPLLAIGSLILLPWRRRFALTVGVTIAIVSSVSILAAGAAFLVLCSIATRRRPLEIAIVVLVYVAASQVSLGLYPIREDASPMWLQLAGPVLAAGTAVAIGAAIGARRVELRSLRDRAESAEREQAARAAQAKAVERNRIAREMHDVLAHRISLVAMQAGVLDHRGDLTAEENRVLVRGIAEGAHQALEELRDVLGVLRSNADRPEAPQPCIDQIPELVADASASGMDIELTDTVQGRPSSALGRTCYRIVQEGLTNAAKHAPGSRVRITVDGRAGDKLHVGVRNSPPSAPTSQPPTSGFGLHGLAERVALAGGELDHQATAEHGYLLTAQLPWPDHNHEKSE